MSASIAYRARSELLKADLQGASDVGLDGKDDRIYKQLLNEDREFEEIETPYGKLIKTEVLSTSVFLELSVGDLSAAVAISFIMIIAAILVLVLTRIWGTKTISL